MKKRKNLGEILTREFLHTEHVVKQLTMNEISKNVGCDHKTVAYWIRYWEIPYQPSAREQKYMSLKLMNHVRWKGYQEIPLTYFNNLKNGAKNRNIPFSVSIEDVWDLYVKQQKRCALTGRQLGFTASKKATASLDRIDPRRGYEKENLQWLHVEVNYAKQSMTQEEFRNLCKEVVEYDKSD